MTSKPLKIALAVSVALNLFAVAAGITVWSRIQHHDARVSEMGRSGPRAPLRDILGELDPSVQERVHTAMRASALAARPDFEAARTARRQAVTLAEAPVMQSSAVIAALNESRAAEARGRARLESDAVDLLQTLDPADRVALSKILTRRGGSRSTEAHPSHNPPIEPDKAKDAD